MIVAKSMDFCAAHFLPNYEGKCRNLHGHNWKVELAVEGEVDVDSGMVIDFTLLNQFLKEKVEGRFDHALVNDVIENPTAENIASRIKLSWDLWREENCPSVCLAWIKVWESGDAFAMVEG